MRNTTYLIIIVLLAAWAGIATWKLCKKSEQYVPMQTQTSGQAEGSGTSLQHSESGTLTFSEKITAIDMEDDSGGVQIIGKEEAGTTEVGIEKTARTATDCVVDAKVENGVLKIKSKIKQGSNAKVDFKIRVPKNVTINVEIGAGGVAIHNIIGDAKIGVGAGGIDAEDVFGATTVRTGAGGITLKYSQLPGKTNIINAQIGSGGLDVSVPKGAKVQYDVSSMGTNNKLDCAGTPDYVIKGSIGAGGFSIQN